MPTWMVNVDNSLVTRSVECDDDYHERISRLITMTLEALEWLSRRHSAA